MDVSGTVSEILPTRTYFGRKTADMSVALFILEDSAKFFIWTRLSLIFILQYCKFALLKDSFLYTIIVHSYGLLTYKLPPPFADLNQGLKLYFRQCVINQQMLILNWSGWGGGGDAYYLFGFIVAVYTTPNQSSVDRSIRSSPS